MKSRAPLALMEQTVMVLVFALAAALCLRAFVLADGISRRVEATDRAVLWAESAADTLKARNGDLAQAAAELGGNLADRRLAQNSWSAVTGYYQADCQAQEILSQLRAGERPDGVTAEGEGVFSYACPISDAQTLEVRVRLTGESHEILSWQAVFTADWQADEDLDLWDGST